VRAVLAVVALVLACGAREPSIEASTLPLEECHVEGSPRPARCGVLSRPEDPDAPEGRSIALRVAVIPAQSAVKHAPLYLLAGGPGQGATEAFAPLLPAFEDLGEHRDFVLVDQRGTGSSAPLDCDDEDKPLAEKLENELDREELRACFTTLQSNADTTKYLTTIAMDDLDAVREALGHERIDLYGGSYGTRAALVYARQHPDRVGKLVLDGVAPVDMTMPISFARDAQAALDRTFADCAADPGCAESYPRAQEKLEAWLATLPADTAGAGKTVAVTHPRTGVVEDVVLTRALVGGAIRGVLYSPDLAAMLPHVLDQAEAGDISPLVGLSLAIADSAEDSMSTGMLFSVVCSEDVPYLDEATAARETKDTVVGPEVVKLFRDACSVWSSTDVPAGYREPVHSDAPTLVLSGELDPVTPPRWGEHVLEHLPNGRHVVVPGSGHGTTSVRCVRDIMAAFLDDLEPDTTCVESLHRPPFFVDFAGPPA
jgi:pimeloyl-ACP methyl ester carboxylesterase